MTTNSRRAARQVTAKEKRTIRVAYTGLVALFALVIALAAHNTFFRPDQTPNVAAGTMGAHALEPGAEEVCQMPDLQDMLLESSSIPVLVRTADSLITMPKAWADKLVAGQAYRFTFNLTPSSDSTSNPSANYNWGFVQYYMDETAPPKPVSPDHALPCLGFLPYGTAGHTVMASYLATFCPPSTTATVWNFVRADKTAVALEPTPGYTVPSLHAGGYYLVMQYGDALYRIAPVKDTAHRATCNPGTGA